MSKIAAMGSLKQLLLFATMLLLVLLVTMLRVVTPALALRAPTPPPPRQISTQTPVTDPLVVRIYFRASSEVDQLAASLDVWEVNRSAGYLVAAVESDEYNRLIQEGFSLVVDHERTAALAQTHDPLPGQTSGIPSFPCYRTVEETYRDLEGLAQNHPNLAEWIDMGDSWERTAPDGKDGYDLFTLVLTNKSVASPAPKPRFFLLAAIHAREYATAELAARFAEHLAENYGTDPDITWLLDYFEIHIAAVANPDGRKFAEEGYYQRKNTNNSNGGSCAVPPQPSDHYGTDLNRNHSFNWGGASSEACSETYQGPSSTSEPETQALETYLKGIFADQRGEAEGDPAPLSATGLLISLHSYSQLVLWPWGWSDQPAPNGPQLKTLGHKLAFFNQYQPQQSSALYSTTGDTTDFVYGELGVAAFTFELGTEFFEDCTSFEDQIYPDNLDALLYAFKAARLPYQNPSGPDSLNLTLSSQTTAPGSPVTLTAQADDARYMPGPAVEIIADARYSIDAPAWVENTPTFQLNPLDGNLDSYTETVRASIDTTGWTQGRHTIFVQSQDSAGNWGVPSAIFVWVSEQEPALYFPLVGK